MIKSILVLLVVCVAWSVQAPYKEFDPYPFTANTTTCGSGNGATKAIILSTLKSNLASSKVSSSSSRLIIDPSQLFAYAEDYGHIIHALPIAAFVPRSQAEVVVFVAVANLLSFSELTKFQIVVRGGSGNVQGATQGSCSERTVILDTTYLNSVEIGSDYAWVGPGAPWLSLIQAAAAQGLRPTVIPDYLGITVGGFVSVGGFGGDTPVYGPVVDQVTSLKIVTPKGLLVTAGPGNQYFEAARGGMGLFGVVTAIKLKLVPTKPFTQTVHILTPSFGAYLETMKSIINNYMPSRVDTIQSFAIPNNEASYEIFLAPKAELDAVRANVDNALALNQSWVYYIELAVRTVDYSDVPSKAEIGSWLAPSLDPALIFLTNYSTPDWDNRLKLFTVPALVAAGAWYAPHPWTVVAFPDSSASSFDSFLQLQDPVLDIGMGLVALYPCKTSLFNQASSLSVPTSSPFFYLATLGRNEITGSPAILQRQERGNRLFWDQFKAQGQSSIYASSYITDFGPSDWEHSFGSKWQQFLQTKKKLDPRFLFADQRNFGFASLY